MVIHGGMWDDETVMTEKVIYYKKQEDKERMKKVIGAILLLTTLIGGTTPMVAKAENVAVAIQGGRVEWTDEARKEDFCQKYLENDNTIKENISNKCII